MARLQIICRCVWLVLTRKHIILAAKHASGDIESAMLMCTAPADMAEHLADILTDLTTETPEYDMTVNVLEGDAGIFCQN